LIDEACSNKMVTALTMEGGQSLQTEELEYQLACTRSASQHQTTCMWHAFDVPDDAAFAMQSWHDVGQQLAWESCSSDGQCPCECDYSQADCSCRDLESSITIHVTKSPVSLLYPLTYRKTVNYYPIEQVQPLHQLPSGLDLP
jgi:hypothetical protein